MNEDPFRISALHFITSYVLGPTALSLYPPAPLLQATRLVESSEVFLKSVKF